MVTQRLTIGKNAEHRARLFLESRGYQFIAQNWQCYTGEIDLIVRDKTQIIFVEVRARREEGYTTPLESVDWAKQQKIIKTALHFLQEKNWLDTMDCRFDIICIANGKLEWIKDAFTADGVYD